MGRSSLRHAFAFVLGGLAVVLAPAVAAAQPGGAPADAWSDEPPGTPTAAPAPVTAPITAPVIAPVDESPEWQHETGLLLEVRFEGARSNRLYNPWSGTTEAPEPRGALFAGYQLRRWSFGVGLELARTTVSTDDDSTSDDAVQSTFGILPGARVSIGRSRDGRAELLGVFDLGLGESRFVQNNGGEDLVYERFRLQLGPGVRYWLASAFALGATAVIRHDRWRNVVEDAFSGNEIVSESANTDLVTSLNVTGVF
ncbi:MAG TPA: hypothetical protein VM261_05870 [Kofleriaceae bacterium]|nr:hypothetical protein [Kofleriaceae bacterium]